MRTFFAGSRPFAALGLVSLLAAASPACSSGTTDTGDDAGGDDGSAPDSGGPDVTAPHPDGGGHDAGDAGSNVDSGAGDSGTSPDTGAADTGTADGAGGDTGTPDTGTPDAGGDDGGSSEASTDDGGSEASTGDDGGGDATTLDSSTDDGGSEASTGDDGGVADGSASDSGTGADTGADASALPALLGEWNFNEGTGTTSADLSGNNHPATLQAGASWGTGKEGTGLALNGGSTSFADVGVSLIDTTKSFSVMCWLELAAVGPNLWSVALSQDGVHGSVFGLKMRGDNNFYDFDVEVTDTTSPPFVVAQSTTLATAAVFVHLAGVHDATGTGTMKVYVNGVLEATTPNGGPVIAAPGHFLIGRGLYNDATGSWVNGTIDEVAAYGGALTDAQVAAIYAAQK